MDTAGLVYCILMDEDLYISRIMANKLKKKGMTGTSYGERARYRLIFLGLIMGLCRKAGVRFLSKGNISNRYCLEGPTPASNVPPAKAVPVTVVPPEMPQLGHDGDWNWQIHMAHQRAFLYIQDYIHHLSLQELVGTKDDLETYASWPEGMPDDQEGQIIMMMSLE